MILDPEKEWEITGESLLYVNKISAFVGMKGKDCLYAPSSAAMWWLKTEGLQQKKAWGTWSGD